VLKKHFNPFSLKDYITNFSVCQGLFDIFIINLRKNLENVVFSLDKWGRLW